MGEIDETLDTVTHTHTHTHRYSLNELLNTITLGDSYKIIKDIPDKSIDLICIDPPYELETHGGGKSQLAKQIQEQHKELYENNLHIGISNELLEELYKKMKKINICIFCNKKQLFQYMKFFIEKGCLFDLITWHKTNAIPNFSGKYMSDTEYCLIFRKGKEMNKESENYEDRKTWYMHEINIRDKENYKHPTIKPIELIKRLIRNHSYENDIVLDCFSGSGTTCVACKELNRQFIGIEINPEYHRISLDRLNGILANGQISFDTDISMLGG